MSDNYGRFAAFARTLSIPVNSQVRGIFRFRERPRRPPRSRQGFPTTGPHDGFSGGLRRWRGWWNAPVQRHPYMGVYLDPDGHKRSAGSFSTRREAQRAANREEQKVLAGAWHDTTLGDITFRDYVETEWLPHKHLEASTRAAYVSYLNKHFYPFFGHGRSTASPRLWSRTGSPRPGPGLSPRSMRKYHVMLSSIFGRAVKDRILVTTRATTPSCQGHQRKTRT